ncbi:MAG: hypothetical protein AB3N63_11100 [Puniceicoccaceae bacterium]
MPQIPRILTIPLLLLLAAAACPAQSPVTATLDPSTHHQTMVGFGGALTWYSNWVFHGSNADAINQLMFEDLGLDIVRFQNWYFPDDYPNNKDVAGMPDESHWDGTTDFYESAMSYNPDIKVLLSSWGPPATLKSNDDSRNGGTLKKVEGEFVYDQYAQYWVDTLDRLEFVPDYLSIQNEPGYTASWTSCVWRPTETEDFAGYDKAIDAVYDVIKDRPEQPLLIGAEVENIGNTQWDNSLNIFREFTTPLKSRDHVVGYAYHLYNIWRIDKIDTVIPQMHIIRDEFSEKPSFMTEYSREFAGWLETSRIIQNSLIEANTSAYFHWKLAWIAADNPEQESTMISVNWAGDYAIHENYYAIKHFSKFMDAGYIRVGMSGSDSTLRISAFIRPDGRNLVIHALNAATGERSVDWNLATSDVASVMAVRSTEGSLFTDIGSQDLSQQHNLPAESLTTYVIDLNNSLRPDLDPVALLDKSFDLQANSVSLTVQNQPDVTFTLWHSSDMQTWTEVTDATIVEGETTTTLTDPSADSYPSFYRVRGDY